MNETAGPLLAAGEPEPVTIHNSGGTSPLVLVADHAGNRLPHSLGTLGLPASERERHIAWDIGIAGVAHLLADALDAVLIRQNYSRLVIDCNRPPEIARVDAGTQRTDRNPRQHRFERGGQSRA